MELGPDWPHRIVLTHSKWDEVQEWCEKNFGEFGNRWAKLGIDPAASLFGDYSSVWFFKKEKDASMFALRWR